MPGNRYSNITGMAPGVMRWRRSRTWDRLTLLRRIGHTTEAFSDEQLLDIAEACGVEDNALRKMHMDHLPRHRNWSTPCGYSKMNRALTGHCSKNCNGPPRG